MVEVVDRLEVTMEDMMGMMEMLAAAMVVVMGVLLWLVKLEATITLRLTARELLGVALDSEPSPPNTPPAMTFSQRSLWPVSVTDEHLAPDNITGRKGTQLPPKHYNVSGAPAMTRATDRVGASSSVRGLVPAAPDSREVAWGQALLF